MKKNYLNAAIFFTAVFFAFSASADQTADGKAERFSLSNGAKVIILPISNNDVVSVRSYILGGSANYPLEKAGIESLWLSTALKGSVNYPKEKLYPFLEETGSYIDYSADRDFSSFDLKCLRFTLRESMDVYFDLLLNPAMLKEEFNLSKERHIAGAKARKEDPEGYLAFQMNQALYKGHAYEAHPSGSEESLPGITLEDVMEHKAKALTGKNLLIVIVGKVSKETLLPYIEDKLKSLPSGSNLQKEAKPFTPAKNTFPLIEKSEIPTNYILGKFVVSGSGSREYWAMKIALTRLSRSLWDAVRTKEGLAYAVGSSMADNRSNFGYIYLSTTDPQKALSLIKTTLADAVKNGLPEKEIENAKTLFQTRYLMGIESNGGLAGFIAWNEICGEGFIDAATVLATVRSLTAKEVNDALAKGLEKIYWAAIGSPDNLNPKIFFDKP